MPFFHFELFRVLLERERFQKPRRVDVVAYSWAIARACPLHTSQYSALQPGEFHFHGECSHCGCDHCWLPKCKCGRHFAFPAYDYSAFCVVCLETHISPKAHEYNINKKRAVY